MKKKDPLKKWISIIAVAVILLAAIFAVLIVFHQNKMKEERLSEESLALLPEIIVTIPDIPLITPEPETVYPEPAYAFKEEEVTVELSGIEKEYRIAWVSDVHMVNDFEAADDIMEDQLETIIPRHDIAFIDENGTPSNELWPEIIRYLNYQKFDAVIFGGDIMDYLSKKNIEYMTEYYNQLREDVPILFIRADHDYGGWYSGGQLNEGAAAEFYASYFADGDSSDSKMLDMGEFMLIGINRSTKGMPEWQYNWFKTRYEWAQNDGKPVIIVTHVPYESKVDPSLEELSFQVRNKVYYWGGGDYVPYDFTRDYFDEFIYSDNTIVEQVLAGHLHASWDGNITDTLPEHIFAPAYQGSIGVIHIVPKNE